MPWRKAAAARGGRPPPPRAARPLGLDVAPGRCRAARAALAASAPAAAFAGGPRRPAAAAGAPPPVPVGPGSRAMRVRLHVIGARTGAGARRPATCPPERRRHTRRSTRSRSSAAGGQSSAAARAGAAAVAAAKPPDLVWKLRAPAPSADGGRGGPQGPAHLSLVGSGGELMRVVLQPPQPVQQTANGQQPLPGPWPPLEHQRPSQPSSAMMLQQANNDGTSGGGYDEDEAEGAPSYGTEIPRPKKKKRRPPHKGPHGSPFKGSTVDKLRAAAAASVKGVAAPAERPPKLEALQVRRLPSRSPPRCTPLPPPPPAHPPFLSDQRHPSPGRVR